MNEKRRKIIMTTVVDLVADFLYYDRKEDEELGEDEIQEAIENGETSIDEIVGHFRKILEASL